MEKTFSVYVASGLKNYQQVLWVQRQLIGRGINITFNWAEAYENNIPARPEDMLEGVKAADVLLLLIPAKRGAHVEFGVAIGLGKPCVVVCPHQEDEISFYHPLGVRLTKSEAQAIEWLKEMEQANVSGI